MKNKFKKTYSALKAISYKLKAEGGFTLVEALVAIFILSVGVTGVVILISRSTMGFSVSKERLVATNLAQEGIEVIHNIRDNNWLNSDQIDPAPVWNDWDGNGAGDSCGPCTGYVLWNSANFLNSGGGLDLKWNSVNNRYNDAGTENIFYRIITITDLGDLSSPLDGTIDYVSVKSTVGWGGAGSCSAGGIAISYRYCLTLEERLYDWR